MTGRGSAKLTGALDLVLPMLKSLEILYEIFDKIEPNPLIETVQACIN